MSQMNPMKKNLKNVSESGSAGTLSTGFGVFLHGFGLLLNDTISSDETCDGNGGSLVS